MKRYAPIIALIVLCALAACLPRVAAQAEAQPTTTRTLAPSPTRTPTATIRQKPTSTYTATPLPAVETRKSCITVEDSLPPDLHPGGELLLSNWGEYDTLFHMDLMSRRASPFTAEGYASDFAVSPDGKWLAYLDITRENNGQKGRVLKVANAEGRHLDMDYWLINWQWIVGWRDEKTLLLFVPGYPGGDYIFLNPFTMHKEVVAVDIPHVDMNDKSGILSSVIPSPDLSRIIFMANDQTYFLHLAETSTQKILWEDAYIWDGNAVWSPDGRYFAAFSDIKIPTTPSILRVSKDGQVVPLTNRIMEWREVYWSPDSQFLAAWLQIGPKADPRDQKSLVLINVEKPLLTDLCFQSRRDYYSRNSTVWSPDGRFLAIETTRLEKDPRGHNENHHDTLLIDLSTWRAYPLVNDAYPVAWMRKPGSATSP